MGERIEEAAVQKMDAVYRAVEGRLRHDALAGSVLDQLRAEPNDGLRQGALQYALLQSIQADPSFAAKLEQLVKDVEDVSPRARMQIKNAGAVSLGGNLRARDKTTLVKLPSCNSGSFRFD
jgi:hypothetical protein